MILEERRKELLSIPPPQPEALWISEPKGGPDELKPNRAGFVENLLSTYRFVTIRDTDECLIYDGFGLYNGGARAFVREWVERQFEANGKTPTSTFVTETFDSVRRRTYRERYTLNPLGYLCLLNGVLDLRGDEPKLVPHDPDQPFVTRLPVEYYPGATCEKWREFLNMVLPEAEQQALLQEWFGYTLMPGNPYKLALFLVGPPDSGKSTALEVLRGIIGPENTTTVALQSLADNRFAAASLFGKLANIYTDLSPKLVRDVGVFKMLTGGSDHIPAEKKFQDSFQFVNAAKLIFSANSMPPVPWADDAFFRRWTLISFGHPVPHERQQPYFERVLLREASGIFGWALEGLLRLRGRGGFDPASIERTRSEWRRLSDSLSAFVEDRVARDPSARISKQEFYSEYAQYCEESGLDAKTAMEVSRELPMVMPGVHGDVRKMKEKGGRSVRVWVGARLRNEGDRAAFGSLESEDS